MLALADRPKRRRLEEYWIYEQETAAALAKAAEAAAKSSVAASAAAAAAARAVFLAALRASSRLRDLLSMTGAKVHSSSSILATTSASSLTCLMGL